jgi:Putative bacterial sensory transduction regulator
MTASPTIVAAAAIRAYLSEEGMAVEETEPGTFVLQLPGEKKLKTTVSLVVGDHSLSVNAFVARHPDENRAGVYQWLLERNRRMFRVAYCVDHLGDVYLVGRLPLDAVTDDALDGVLGEVLTYADGDFNTILELGFETSIRNEWAWRLSRGESTRNLEAFRHLAPTTAPDRPPAGTD